MAIWAASDRLLVELELELATELELLALEVEVELELELELELFVLLLLLEAGALLATLLATPELVTLELLLGASADPEQAAKAQHSRLRKQVLKPRLSMPGARK